ncbi:MAG: hypothetical protein RI902_2114, partial [Pseudomonadota bacterium]
CWAISAAIAGLALPVKTMKSGVEVDMVTGDFRYKFHDALVPSHANRKSTEVLFE